MPKKKRYDNCIICNEYGHIYSRDRCRKCYEKWCRARPEAKKKHAERMRKWRKEHPEVYRAIEERRSKTEKRKKWCDKYNKEQYALHAEERKAYQVQWRKDNPEQYEMYWRAAYARKKNAEGKYTKQQWLAIAAHYCPDNICPHCDKPFDQTKQERKLSVDHVIPLTKGGTNYPENLQPLCYSCNCSKGDGSSTDYRHDKGEFARSLQ